MADRRPRKPLSGNGNDRYILETVLHQSACGGSWSDSGIAIGAQKAHPVGVSRNEGGRHPGKPGDDGYSDHDGDHLTHFVVPDDIRELDPDIRAYHREQRVARRRATLRQIVGRSPFGVALPVAVTIALVVAVYSIVMLTVASDPPADRGAQLAAPTIAPGKLGGLLPDVGIRDAEGARQPLRSLRPAAIVLMPLQCNCDGLLETVTAQSDSAHVPIYLISTQLPRLADGVGPPTNQLRSDPSGQIHQAYDAMTGPVVLLVRADGVLVEKHTTLPPDDVLRSDLTGLRSVPA